MPPIRAQAADGSIHEFPSDTPPEVIDRVMKEYAQGGGSEAPKRATGEKPPEALKETAPGEFTGESGSRYSETPRKPIAPVDLDATNRLAPKGLPSVEDLRGSIFRNILGKEPPPATPEPPPSRLGAFGQGAAKAVLPTLGGYLVARGGFALGSGAGPFAPVAAPGLAVTGAIAGATGVSAAQEAALNQLSEEQRRSIGLSEQQLSESQEAYPYTYNAGALAPSLLVGGPLAGLSRKAILEALKREGPAGLRRLLGESAVKSLPGAGVGAAISGGSELVGQGMTGGQIDTGKVVQSALAGALTAQGRGNVSPLARELSAVQQPSTRTDQLAMGALRLGQEATPVDVLPPDVVETLAANIGRTNPQAARDLLSAVETRTAQMPGALQAAAEDIPGIAPGATARGVEEGAKGALASRQGRIEAGKRNIVNAAEAEQKRLESTYGPTTEAAVPPVTRGQAGQSVREKLVAQKEAEQKNYNDLFEAARAEGDVPIANRLERGDGDTLFDPVSGVGGKADEIGPSATDAVTQIREAALGKRLSLARTNIPKVEGLLNQLDPNNLSFRNLIDARRLFSEMRQGNADPTEASAAADAIRAIDDVIRTLDSAGRFGESSAASAWRNANSAFSKYMDNWDGTFADKIVQSDAPGASAALFGGADTMTAQTPNKVSDLMNLRDRLGADSPEWQAVQNEALDRALSRDIGKPTFGKAYDKWARVNPEMADLLTPPGGRDALIKAQGQIAETAAGVEAAKGRAAEAGPRAADLAAKAKAAFDAKVTPVLRGQDFMADDDIDFRNAVDSWTPSQRQTAKIGVRQAMRDAVGTPESSLRLLTNLANNDKAQANLRTLLGKSEADAIIVKAAAATEVASRLGALSRGARSGLGASPSEGDMADLAGGVVLQQGAMGGKVTLFANALESVMRLITAKGLSSEEALRVARDLLDPAKADAVRAQLAQQVGDGPAEAAMRRAKAFYEPLASKLSAGATRAAVTLREREEPTAKKEKPPAPEPEKANMTSAPATDANGKLPPIDVNAELPKGKEAEIAMRYIAHAEVEGTGDNPRSTAQGYGQLLKSTFAESMRELEPELTAGKSDDEINRLRTPERERAAAMNYAQKGVDALYRAGFPVTPATVYATHHFGPTGGVNLLESLAANPNASAESVLGPAVVAANPQFKGLTAGEVKAWIASHLSKSFSPGAS